MDCEHTIRQVYIYLDGEMTTYRRWQITRHLNRCPPCKDGFDFELELRRVLQSRCRDAVPEELKQRIADAIACFDQGEPPQEEKNEKKLGSGDF
jgi:mycothiol system anti-sigma-R factor